MKPSFLLLLALTLPAAGGETNAPALAASSREASQCPEPLPWNTAAAHWQEQFPARAAAPDTAPDLAAKPLATAGAFDLASGGNGELTTAEAERLDRILRPPRDPQGVRLGQSDYVISSPFLEGFLPRPKRDDLSRGEKFLRLPVISWVRPLPMGQPPGGGRYFKWGERSEPWEQVARPPGGPRAADNALSMPGPQALPRGS